MCNTILSDVHLYPHFIEQWAVKFASVDNSDNTEENEKNAVLINFAEEWNQYVIEGEEIKIEKALESVLDLKVIDIVYYNAIVGGVKKKTPLLFLAIK